jgi:hypothetical protein
MRSECCDMTVHWVCSACHTALRWPGEEGLTVMQQFVMLLWASHILDIVLTVRMRPFASSPSYTNRKKVTSYSRAEFSWSRNLTPFMEQKFHYRVHMIPAHIRILKQINPVYTLHPIYLIRFNIILRY